MKENQPAVFVVDDDESVRTAVARALRTVGLEVASFGPTRDFLQSKQPHAPAAP
jgi:FixJ family two-component response regulator